MGTLTLITAFLWLFIGASKLLALWLSKEFPNLAALTREDKD